MSDDNDDEKVGYKRPPKKSQFKPGQSGNPRGRPPRRRSKIEVINDLAQERVAIMVNGRKRWVSLEEAMIRKAVTSAITTGKVRDVITLLTLLQETGVQPWEERKREQEIAAAEAEQRIRQYFDRMLEVERPSTDDQ